MGIFNPLKGERKGGTVGKPLPGVQVSPIFWVEINILKSLHQMEKLFYIP